MRKLIYTIPFLIIPLISLCQSQWLDDAIVDALKSDFFKCNLKENINKFDTVKIYCYHINSSNIDSNCIAVFPINKTLIPQEDTSYSSFFGLLPCKKTFYTNNKVESLVAFYDNKPIQFVKYKYNKSDTILITKYNNVNDPKVWKLEEQIIFNRKNNETRYYFYKTPITSELFRLLKKDNQNRVIYEENCVVNEYKEKIKYKYSTDSLLVERVRDRERVASHGDLIITCEKYSYNKNGLFDIRIINKILYNGVFLAYNGFYSYLKYYYK